MVSVNPVSNYNNYDSSLFDLSFSSVKTEEERKDDPLNALLDVRSAEAAMEDLKLTSILAQAQAKYPGMNITR